MARIVDDSRPYTDEEKAFLLTRSGGDSLIAINDRQFAHLSEEKRAVLQGRSIESEKKEAAIQEKLEAQAKADSEDSYHDDDIAKVEPMTIAQLQQALEEEGLSPDVTKADKQGEEGDDPLTEKQVLAYRLLNRLDEKRNAAK